MLTIEALEKLKLLTQETGPEPSPVSEAEACETLDAVLNPRSMTDAELSQMLTLHEGDVYAAAYEVLIRKSQSTKVTVAGMTTAEQERYWLRQAAMVRKNQGKAAERDDQP